MEPLTIMSSDLNVIMENLGAIKASLKNVEDRLDRLENNQEARLEKLEDRVRVLENWRWMVIGISMAASAIINHFFK